MLCFRPDKILSFLTEVMSVPVEPPFATPNTIRLETEALKLRQVGNDKNPVLILPPQAGHSSAICDLSSTNSLVRTLIENGCESISYIDYKPATYDRGHETILDLLMQTNQCVDNIGEKVHLIGLCQGGWQATLYTAFYPEKVKSLTIAGSPIDTHIGQGMIWQVLQTVPYSFYKDIVFLNGGIYPGYLQLAAFKSMNPFDRYVKDYISLFNNIDDKDFLLRNRVFMNWYNYTQHLAGGWFLEAVKKIFYDNNLHKIADLKRIKCPVIMIGGIRDDITPFQQVFALSNLVSTSEADMYRFLVDSGHIGIFMASKVLRDIWSGIAKILVKEFS
jgi:poly(3-hydroxybutyrate) depolymerase